MDRAPRGRLPSRLREAGVTEREAEVLAALGGGLSNAEIGTRLFISERTVESHVAAVRRKLGIESRSALIGLGRTIATGALVPLPPALARRRPNRFVGRQAESEVLIRAWKEAMAGESRLILVSGEPGIGKTRLAAEVARSLYDNEAAVVLYGRCDDEMGVPYQPFVEALRHFIGQPLNPDVVCSRLGRYAGELVRVVPELGETCRGLPPPMRSDPDTERYRLFDAVASWLADLSNEAPVVLVLDDLHWAAKPTLLLARHVIRSAEASRLLVIGTYRDTELAARHTLADFLGDLQLHGEVERLALSGLDEAGVAEYVEAVAGRDLDDEDRGLVGAIYAETEGNPFFIGEVLRHLVESGTVVRRDGRWITTACVDEIGIPESVREVIRRRLARLSRATNEVLLFAAVLGAEFDVSLLSATCSLDDDLLVCALEEAAAARLVSELPGVSLRYRFAHALVRDTLYGDLSAARRVALHRRVAVAMETLHVGAVDDHLPALAHHFARALPMTADTARAVEYAARAGHRALAQLANDEAVTYYRQALGLLDAVGTAPGDRRRIELLIDLGEAQRRAGDPNHRKTLLDAARLAHARGDADALARAALANSRGYFSVSGAVDFERLTALEAALEAVGAEDSERRARLLVHLATELTFSLQDQRRHALGAEAISIARRLGSPDTLGRVLAARFVTVPASTDRCDESTELLSVVAALDDPALAYFAALWEFMARLSVGDRGGFQRGLDTAARLATELGQPYIRWQILFNQSTSARIAGHLAEAETLAEQALELGRSAQIRDAFRIYGANIFWIRYDLGRLDTVLDALERAAGRAQPDPLTLLALALALCELDRPQEARPVFDRIAATGFAVPASFVWLYGMTMAAEVCAKLDDTERATVLYERLAPHYQLIAEMGGGATGSVEHYLALLATTLARFPEADDRFAAAASVHERIRAPCWLARTRLEWARTLLRRRQLGDTERARMLLDHALATARELGLGNVERRAVALLPECR